MACWGVVSVNMNKMTLAKTLKLQTLGKAPAAEAAVFDFVFWVIVFQTRHKSTSGVVKPL